MLLVWPRYIRKQATRRALPGELADFAHIKISFLVNIPNFPSRAHPYHGGSTKYMKLNQLDVQNHRCKYK